MPDPSNANAPGQHPSSHVVTCCIDGDRDDPDLAARAEKVRQLARELGFQTLYEVNGD